MGAAVMDRPELIEHAEGHRPATTALPGPLGPLATSVVSQSGEVTPRVIAILDRADSCARTGSPRAIDPSGNVRRQTQLLRRMPLLLRSHEL